MGWGLAPALHVFVAAQGGLPAVSLAAVPTLELATSIVRTVAVSLRVVRFYVGFALKAVVRVNVHSEVVVKVVVFLREHYVVGVVVLGVGLRVLLFGDRFIVSDILTYGVVVLHKRLLEEVGLDVVGEGASVDGQFGEVQRGGEFFGGRLDDVGELYGGRHQRQRLRVRMLRRQQRQQRRREAILW